MPWHVIPIAAHPVVELQLTGLMTSAELTEAVAETVRAVREHGVARVLADCRTLAGGHSVFDLYSLASSVADHTAGRSFKEAVILPDNPRAAELANFWKTTCFNRGLQVRIFSDRETAVAWLVE